MEKNQKSALKKQKTISENQCNQWATKKVKSKKAKVKIRSPVTRAASEKKPSVKISVISGQQSRAQRLPHSPFTIHHSLSSFAPRVRRTFDF
ncbi:MAG: hypothetical protein J7D60_10725 [Prosthecochloris sp.]|nr:hypothetical protein [Prosthecochloris sp.]